MGRSTAIEDEISDFGVYILMKFLKDILLLIIGGVITFICSYWVNSLSNQVPYIDKYVNIEKSVISTQNLFSDDVALYVGNEKVSKVSKVTLYLLNYSDKYFKDMDVSIGFNKPNDDFKILSVHAAGENHQENMVTSIPTKIPYLFNYKIMSAKRTDGYDEFFQLVIYYEGESDIKANDFTVTVLNAEARVRDYDRSHSPDTTRRNAKNLFMIFGFVIGSVIFLFLFVALLSRLTRRWDKKFSQKYANSMLQASQNVVSINNLPIEQRKTIISTLLYEQRKQRWDNMNKFERIIEGGIAPQESDWNIE